MAVYNEKNKNKWTKDGRHYYYKCYYTDMYGNRKQKVSKMFLTSSEAKNAERDFLNKTETTDIINTNVSFETVYNEWLEYKKKRVKSTTYYSLKKRTNKYILDYFKNFKLHSIKVDVINKWSNQLQYINDIGIKHKNRIITELKEILEYAKINYEFDEKISHKLQKQKVEKSISQKDSEYNFWTYEEFQQFIKVVDDDFYYLMFNFLYFTGLRFGEFIALTWEDIDFNKNSLRINKTLSTKVEEVPYLITDPKTNNSIRNIGLNNDLMTLLKQHKTREEKIYKFNEKMFIFGNIKYIAASSFARKLDYYIDIAKVKRITPHGFRHSHVSLLIHLGCDSREVADRIGDTIQVVETTYYHMFPEKKKHTIDVLNSLKI